MRGQRSAICRVSHPNNVRQPRGKLDPWPAILASKLPILEASATCRPGTPGTAVAHGQMLRSDTWKRMRPSIRACKGPLISRRCQRRCQRDTLVPVTARNHGPPTGWIDQPDSGVPAQNTYWKGCSLVLQHAANNEAYHRRTGSLLTPDGPCQEIGMKQQTCLQATTLTPRPEQWTRRCA